MLTLRLQNEVSLHKSTGKSANNNTFIKNNCVNTCTFYEIVLSLHQKNKTSNNLEPAATDKRHKIMKTTANNFETFKANLYNFISEAIKKNISGSIIADTLEGFGINREAALTAIAMVGTKLNLEANPSMTWQEAFKSYAF